MKTVEPELVRPLYFRKGSEYLFGCHHQPVGQANPRGAVVLCPAIGDEYYYSHRTLRQLSSQLARAGFHVFRFDYFGTGDSAGQDESATLAQWLIDVGSAIDQVKQLSRCDQISVVGIRLGATLAWQAVKERSDIDGLVLWNPVLSGSNLLDHWTEMQSNHNQALGFHSNSFGLTEIMGTQLSPTLVSELQDLKMSPLTRLEGPTLVLINQETKAINTFAAETKKMGSTISLEVVDDPDVWQQNDLEAIVASAALKAILQWLETHNG